MKSALVLVAAGALLPSAFAAPVAAPTVTGVDLHLPTNAFGGSIEGATVNKQGDIFAADFQASGAPASFAYGFLSQSNGGTANVLGKDNPFFVAANDTEKPPLLAGGRFLRDGRLLATDASNKRVLAITPNNKQATVFCTSPSFLQPNDLALSTTRDTLIYLSGQNFTSTTTAGSSGDLWTCDGGHTSQFPPALLLAADIHRTNGIETSPDGRSLYLSSAKNLDGAVVHNRIFKFALDPRTGALLAQKPELFYDFVGGDEAKTDVDGMRADVQGNLYVTRNGLGRVVKLSSGGKLLQTIELPGMGGPSNLELGGPQGKTLVAIGRCKADGKVGCAAAYETGVEGKAWKGLQKRCFSLHSTC